jgi:adenylate cyclase
VAHWRLGYPEKGLAIGREALSLAERIGHPFSLELTLMSSAGPLGRGEPELALQRLGAAEALVAEQRLAFVMEPRFMRGAALSAQGAFAEAVACLREGLAGPRGATRTRPYGLAELAEALTRQGEHGAALAAVREGREVQERTGQRSWDAELHRLEGIALFGLSRLEEGQNALEEALRIARRRQTKAYELRAATGPCPAVRRTGPASRSARPLAPVAAGSPGHDTADLKAAPLSPGCAGEPKRTAKRVHCDADDRANLLLADSTLAARWGGGATTCAAKTVYTVYVHNVNYKVG